MFTLPSIWNLIVSTVVFFIVAMYINRFLDAKELPKGAKRSLSVFALAYLLSWGAGEAADWLAGTPTLAQASINLSQLFNLAWREVHLT